MKTPMQEHIEWLKERHKHFSSEWEMSVVAGLKYAIDHAESLLEKEKEVLITTAADQMHLTEEEALESAKQYYNETFNTKEK